MKGDKKSEYQQRHMMHVQYLRIKASPSRTPKDFVVLSEIAEQTARAVDEFKRVFPNKKGRGKR